VATKHRGLPVTRGQTWSEVIGRIAVYASPSKPPPYPHRAARRTGLRRMPSACPLPDRFGSAAAWVRVRALGAYGVGMAQPLGVTRLGLLGVPTSVASFAPGQEKAPRALRDAGIVQALMSAGVEVEDYGDLPARRWAPDHLNTRAQNVAAVVDDVVGVRDRIGHIIGAGRRHLVLGVVARSRSGWWPGILPPVSSGRAWCTPTCTPT